MSSPWEEDEGEDSVTPFGEEGVRKQPRTEQGIRLPTNGNEKMNAASSECKLHTPRHVDNHHHHSNSGEPTSTFRLLPQMAEVLRPHQVAALQFAWDKLVDRGIFSVAARYAAASVEQRYLLSREVFGCIIGHSMGLGKTLTAISFVFLLQCCITGTFDVPCGRAGQVPDALASNSTTTHGPESGDAAPFLRVLVIAPKSCVLHWVDNIQKWRTPAYAQQAASMPTHRLMRRTPVEATIEEFYRRGGFLFLSYEEYLQIVTRDFAVNGNTKSRESPVAASLERRSDTPHHSSHGHIASALDRIRTASCRPNSVLAISREDRCGVSHLDMIDHADIIILDEAHRLRRDTSLTVSALRLHTQCIPLRIALTGTPIQNHLGAYNVMQSIVTGSAIEMKKFSQLFIQPIERGQCVDATYKQFLEMQECVGALRRFFADTVHHAGPEVLEAELPPRREFVLFFSLSSEQEAAYRRMLSAYTKEGMRTDTSFSGTLHLHHEASHIACHPALFKGGKRHKSPTPPPVSPGSLFSYAQRAGSPNAQEPWKKQRRLEKEKDGVELEAEEGYQDIGDEEGDEGVEEGDEGASSFPPHSSDSQPAQHPRLLETYAALDMKQSPKLHFTIELVSHIVNNLGEKVVVFSMYTTHLTLISALLRHKRNIEAPIFSGQLSDTERQRLLSRIHKGTECRVLLCSLRAGGVGIDLVTANHCILFDVSWNPSDDIQASYRTFRYGQTRPVAVYRLATAGTTEQVVFSYALRKSWLHKKIADVKDPARQQRHRARDYITYPCQLYIHTSPALREIERTVDPPAQKKEKEKYFLSWCEEECRAAAHVFYFVPPLLQALANVFTHSFLLRDDSKDVIRSIGKRFDVERRQVKALRQSEWGEQRRRAAPRVEQEPSPLSSEHPPPPPAAHHKTSMAAEDVLSRCEHKLLKLAQRAAASVVHRVLQPSGSPREVRRNGTVDIEAVRALEKELLASLNPLLEAAAAAPGRLSDGPGTAPAPVQLVEWFIRVYQIGVDVLLSEILRQPHNGHYRNLLSQRIPKGGGGGTTGLREMLAYQPHRLLGAMPRVEAMYLATELGLPRELIPQLFVCGVRRVWEQGTCEALHPLLLHFLCMIGCEDAKAWCGAAGEALNSDAEADGAGRCTNESIARLGWEHMETALGTVWRAFDTFQKPSIPFDVTSEEGAVRQALAAAAKLQGLSSPFSLDNVASILLLPALHSDPQEGATPVRTYGCPRCRGTPLMTREQIDEAGGRTLLVRSQSFPVLGSTKQSSPDLQCPRCHYNVSFHIQHHPQTHHRAALYQLSVVCNLLDAFSVGRSVQVPFTGCRSVWAALQQLPSSLPVLHFVDTCLNKGIRDLTLEIPAETLWLLITQSGAQDAHHLASLLHCNSYLLFAQNIRENVRRGVQEACRSVVGPAEKLVNSSMPFLLLILALHCAALSEGATHAFQLLETSSVSGESAATPSRSGNLLPTMSDRRTLLRFVCDGLVKLCYIEKRLRHDGVEVVYPEKGSDTLQASPTSFLSNAALNAHREGPPLEGSQASFSSSSATSSTSFLLRESFTPPATCKSLEPSDRGEEEGQRAQEATAAAPRDAGVTHPLQDADRTPITPTLTLSPSLSPQTDSLGASSATESFAPMDSMELSSSASAHSGDDARGNTERQNPATPLPDATAVLTEAGREDARCCYWAAFCEVFGARHASQAVIVEVPSQGVGETSSSPVTGRDGQSLRVVAPAPSGSWRQRVHHGTGADGLRVHEVIDEFLEKLQRLADVVPLL